MDEVVVGFEYGESVVFFGSIEVLVVLGFPLYVGLEEVIFRSFQMDGFELGYVVEGKGGQGG